MQFQLLPTLRIDELLYWKLETVVPQYFYTGNKIDFVRPGHI